VRRRRAVPSSIRRRVAERADRRCEYCRCPEAFSLDTFTIDHIDPARGEGENAADNLAYACRNCNNRKQDDTSAPDPDTGFLVAIYNPRRDP
jgi:5-methylcytosine-specific restriction endonuclease McrA